MKIFTVISKNKNNQTLILNKTQFLDWDGNTLIGTFKALNEEEAVFKAYNFLIDKSFGTIQINELPDLEVFEITQKSEIASLQ
jgi:hypothetical protein